MERGLELITVALGAGLVSSLLTGFFQVWIASKQRTHERNLRNAERQRDVYEGYGEFLITLPSEIGQAMRTLRLGSSEYAEFRRQLLDRLHRVRVRVMIYAGRNVRTLLDEKGETIESRFYDRLEKELKAATTEEEVYQAVGKANEAVLRPFLRELTSKMSADLGIE